MKILKKFIYPFLLAVMLAIIAYVNYVPGTWFTGWDNLHTEFNFGMNISRSLSSVWEEYQGLGLLAGMAHAADLPRQLFLWGASWFMPASFIRYFFQYLMLFVGTFGVYKTLLFLLRKNENARVFAFLGSLFYVLNLGTIQYFYVQFEPYSTFWGLFPWEMYTLLNFLEKPTRKNLVWLTLVNILAIPQAVVQTIFVVYMLVVGIVLSIYSFHLKSKHAIKTSLIVLGVILSLNAFWLLPNAYFTIHDVDVTKNAINNRMNTDRFFEINKRRGTIADFAVLKEFYFDFQDIDQTTNQSKFLMTTWRNYFNNPFIPAIGYLFFGIILLGLLEKNPYRKYLIGMFVLSMLAFLSDTIFFSELNTVMRSLPLVNQMFRNPFTKFIVPAIFSFSILFSFGVAFIAEHLKKKSVNLTAITVVLVILFGIYTQPVFAGQLFYPSLRIKIPYRYFSLFSYFQQQNKDARIMNLPQDSYWGWGSYKWGSVGSGFLWYGIEQPIMDMAFGVWSDKLEGYYWELQYALKKQDQNLLNAVLTKYDVDYIIFDEDYQPSDSMPEKYLLKQESLLKDNPLLKPTASFGSIHVYKRIDAVNSNINWYSSLPSVTTDYTFDNLDTSYIQHGSYISSTENTENTYNYPFQSVFTNRFEGEQPYSLEETDNSFILKNTIDPGTYNVTLPSWEELEKNLPVEILARKIDSKVEIIARILYPEVYVGEKQLKIPQKDYEFSTTSKNDVIIAVNNTEIFPATNLNEQFKSIAKTHFTNSPLGNTVNVYDITGKNIVNVAASDLGDAYPCTDPQGSFQATSSKQQNKFTLKGNGTPICISMVKPITFEDPSLIQMSFAYQSSKDELPIYCAYSDAVQDCLNMRNVMQFGFSKSKKQLTDYFPYQGKAAPMQISFTLEPNSITDEVDTLSYENVSLTSYPLLSTFTVDEIPKVSPQNYVVEANEKTNITVTIPKIPLDHTTSSYISENKYELNHVANNPLFSTNYFIQNSAGEGVRLYAKDTFINFWLNLDQVDTSSGSIISIEGRKVQGFPLSLNVSSASTKTKFLQTQLDVDKNFSTHQFVIPPTYEFDKGYQILFNNPSYNNKPTVHDIRNVSVYEFPYEYITNIGIENTKVAPPNEIFTKEIEATKNNTASYELNESVSSGILTLSQGYHEGWKAYKLSSNNWLTNSFPFIFGTEIKDHIMVNNWANGWKITKDDTNSKIKIIFWPQYLQYAGYIFFIFSLIFTFFYNKFIISKR